MSISKEEIIHIAKLASLNLTEDEIDSHARKILAWKYYKGLIIDNQK